MWQLFALGSLFAAAGTSAADKYAIVHDRKIHNLIAVFLRTAFFLTGILFIGLWGVLGHTQVFFHPLIPLVAIVSVSGSFAYTYALRHVGAVEIGVVGYLLPFVFFAIDAIVLGTRFSPEQISGIILLVLGGLAFALDGKTHHISKEFSLSAIVMLAIMGLSTGVHAYVFKYLNAHYALNGVSFYTNVETIIAIGLIAAIVASGKVRLLWSRASLAYMPATAIGKSLDAGATILWAQALTLATVSQVTAFQALSPLVLFIVVACGQILFKFTLKEQLDRPRALWKTSAVCLLVLGGFLIT